MLLMVAYAASIGGVGTPVGSPPNLIAIGLLRTMAGVEITFFQWMSLAPE
jgi:sodium-dependent dicarboxylate transporter 2/3/5